MKMEPPPPPTINNPNDDGRRYRPLPPSPNNNHPPPHPPPHHHGGYHHHPPPTQPHPPPPQQHDQQPRPHPPPHATHQHQHQQQQQQPPYYHPNYNHGHGYPAVNYQNYAGYPPPGGGGGGGGGHPSAPPPPAHGAPPHPPPPPHHHHPYHPPVAHNYAAHYDQQAAVAAAYQYPPEQPMAKQAADQHPHYQYPPEQPPPPMKQEEEGDYDPSPVEHRQQPPQQVGQQEADEQPPEGQGVSPPAVETAPPVPAPIPAPGEAHEEEAPVETTTMTTTDNGMNNVEESTPVELPEHPPALPVMEQPADEQDQQATTEIMPVEETPPSPVAEVVAEVTAVQTNEEYPMKKKEEAPTKDFLAENDAKIFPFDSVLTSLETHKRDHGNVAISTSHPTFTKIFDALVANGGEDEADRLWERNFAKLREYNRKNGDCDVPFTDSTLGGWVELQRKSYAGSKQSEESGPTQQRQRERQPPDDVAGARKESRSRRLSDLGFEFTAPMWDVRLRGLMEYQKVWAHCSPPVNHPKLGIWVINQRFNINEMSKERTEALDGLGFVWNHNRKNRSQAKWEQRYEELLEFVNKNKHCNVPATYRHSPLGTWVGKQREEYKKLKEKKSSQLDKYRIDKLNEVNFHWSLQSWTVISWDDRFEALKKFKEKHGHCKVPRHHPDFGNWPVYQKAQYKMFKDGKKSKITAEKVNKLIDIGFFEGKHNADPRSWLSKPRPPKMPSGSTPSAPKREGYDGALSYDWNHQV